MKIRKFSGFVLGFLFILSIFGCKTMFVNDPEKKIRKQTEQDQKEFEKAYAKLRQEHYKNQTRQTRKRMKKNLRKAKKLNKPKKKKSKKDCL
jgi:hypothetical protein